VSAGAPLRIAVLTREDAAFGVRLLAALAEAGLAPVCLGIVRVTWRSRFRRARLLAQKTTVANAAYHNVIIWSRALAKQVLGRAPAVDYASQCSNRLVVTDINDAAMVRFVESHRPDVVLLGESGIVRAPLLALPRLGTLNAHPGWLPTYRGVDVVRWALLLGGPLGATLHWVDRGVDTGDIVWRRPLAVAPGAAIADIEQAARDLALAMLVEGACALARGGTLPREPQRREDGRQYFLMPPWVARRLRAGRIPAAAPAAPWGHGRSYWPVERLQCAQAGLYVERLFEAVPLSLGACVLDFGCGGGQAAARLADRVGRLALWDPDPAARAAATAAVSGRRNATVLAAAPAPPAAFDVVLVNSVLQFVPRCDLPELLAGLGAVLAPGGRVVVSDVIPRGHRARRDILDAARFAGRAGVLAPLAAAATRAAAGYLSASRRQPLTRIDADELAALGGAAGLATAVLPANLTHFRGRFAAVLTHRSAQ